MSKTVEHSLTDSDCLVLEWCGETIEANWTSIAGLHDAPDVVASDTSWSGRSGGVFGCDVFGPRKITAVGEIIGDIGEVKDALTNLRKCTQRCDPIGTGTLAFWMPGCDTPEFVDARLRRSAVGEVVAENWCYRSTIILEWTAVDPAIYAVDCQCEVGSLDPADEDNTPPTCIDHCFRDGPLCFARAESVPGQLETTSDGSWCSAPTIKIKGLINDPWIETDSGRIQISGVVPPGHTLSIDVLSRTVILEGINGDSTVRHDMIAAGGSSSWPTVSGCGDTDLWKFGGSAGLSAEFEVCWNDARI